MIFTPQNAAGDPRNALDLCDVVVGEIRVTGCVQKLRIAEEAPEFGGERRVFALDDFGAHIEAFPNQSPVSQHAHPDKQTKP